MSVLSCHRRRETFFAFCIIVFGFSPEPTWAFPQGITVPPKRTGSPNRRAFAFSRRAFSTGRKSTGSRGSSESTALYAAAPAAVSFTKQGTRHGSRSSRQWLSPLASDVGCPTPGRKPPATQATGRKKW